MKFKNTNILLALLALIFTISVLQSCERIDAGNVGLKINMSGGNKGVSTIKYTTGWNFYIPGLTKIEQIPIYIQHKQYDEIEVWAKGGTIFKVHPILNYQVVSDKADSMYRQFRLSIKEVEEGWMKGIVQQVYRDATNTFESDSLLNNRAGYERELALELQKKLNPYFIVSNTTSGLTPDDALKANIVAKANFVQEALKLEQQQKSIKAQAENDIIIAKRDSSIKVIAAAADAKSNNLRQASLTDNLIKMSWIQAWEKGGSQVPNYISNSAGSSQFLMQLPISQTPKK